jgi:hypothetical protein
LDESFRDGSPTMQALLATGLLQLRPFKPRTTATFGVIASAMNCYLIAPTLQQWLQSWLEYLPRQSALKPPEKVD